ncbi:hypothetical protein B0H10DRAFT_102845 [Mycena sp. CBHHK59/15]|nr:hypothetical protein B0H10DRAFT_102845 [Mycena sp. CBHHK59/15]
MHLLHILPIGILALVAAAQDAEQSNEVLNNKEGQTPCEMQEGFLNSCQNSRARMTTEMTTRILHDHRRRQHVLALIYILTFGVSVFTPRQIPRNLCVATWSKHARRRPLI